MDMKKEAREIKRSAVSGSILGVVILAPVIAIWGGGSNDSAATPSAPSISEESPVIEREQVPFMQGEQTIARYLREGSEAAQRKIAAMADKGCPQLSIVKARQDMTAGDEKAAEASALMLDRHIGAAYYTSLTASKLYARAESHAERCLPAGASQ